MRRIKPEDSNNRKTEFPGHIEQKITLHIALVFFLVLTVGGSTLYMARAISNTTINIVMSTEHVEMIESIHLDIHHLFTELQRAMILKRLDRVDHIYRLRRELDQHIARFLNIHIHVKKDIGEMRIFKEIQDTVVSLSPLIETVIENVRQGKSPSIAVEGEIDAIAHRMPVLTRELNELHYRSIRQMLDQNKEGIKYILWTYLFLVVGGGILLFVSNELFSRKITLPLTRLAEATKKVAGGDFKLRVKVASRDEIGLLSHSFNLMAERLEAQDKMGKDFQQHLEQTVKEQTRELEEANQVLKETQEQMVQLEKMRVIGEMYAALTHEINNPLAIIISNNRMLLKEALEMKYPQEMVSELEAIGRHSGRIAEIIRGLLSFARQEPFDVSPLDLNKLITETVALVEKAFSRMNIEIEKELMPNLPRIKGSWNHLQQVFFNLINNARDALQGGGTIIIRSYQLERTSEVIVEVTDDGTGIAHENLVRIFEPFFTTKDIGKGTGLGLSVSYSIVKAHGGNLRAASEPGKGSCFMLSFQAMKNTQINPI